LPKASFTIIPSLKHQVMDNKTTFCHGWRHIFVIILQVHRYINKRLFDPRYKQINIYYLYTSTTLKKCINNLQKLITN
jgi:hypothetical protein